MTLVREDIQRFHELLSAATGIAVRLLETRKGTLRDIAELDRLAKEGQEISARLCKNLGVDGTSDPL